MSEDDYRILIKLAREAEIRREQPTPRFRFYIGGNTGTYGVGVTAGVIL